MSIDDLAPQPEAGWTSERTVVGTYCRTCCRTYCRTYLPHRQKVK
jgi:hypothetical protein